MVMVMVMVTDGFVRAGNQSPRDDDWSGVRREAPGTGVLTAAVAAGFGVLGWLGAQLATLHVVGHGHAGAAGHGYHHVHGFAAPIAVSAACLVLAALGALWLLPRQPASSGPRVAGRSPIAFVLPVAAFAALELGSSLASGIRPSETLAVLVLGAFVQLIFAAGAQALTRTSVDVVRMPIVFRLPVLVCAPRLVVVGGDATRRSLDRAPPRTSRAPPPGPGP